MTKEDRQAYCVTRLEHANQCLQSADLLIQGGDYKAAANRAYYAVFHAMRAANVIADVPEQEKHTGVARKFREHFLKTGLMDEKLSKTISTLFEIRNESDYDDFFIISKEDTEKQLQNAKQFVLAVKDYLETKQQTGVQQG